MGPSLFVSGLMLGQRRRRWPNIKSKTKTVTSPVNLVQIILVKI